MAGLLAVRVQPGASTDAILGWQGRALRVRVSAPAREGRANAAVARLLAEALGVPPSTVELARGAAGRDKLFRLRTLDTSAARARLGAPDTAPAARRSPR
jgi:uncharacterized protein (TIGR00251 family)